jgi:hypothetical protein
VTQSLNDLNEEQRQLLALRAQAEILRRRNEEWKRNPAAFGRERLGLELTPDQVKVLESVRDNRRTAVRAGNGVGKTFISSVVATWAMECFEPAIVYTSAPSFKQVTDLLWKEIRTRVATASPRLRGRLTPKEPRWDISPEHFAVGRTADSEEGFKGQHTRGMLLIILDEGPGVPAYIYTAAATMLKGKNARLLTIGNPTVTSGPFYDMFHSKQKLYSTLHMSPRTHPNIVEGLKQLGMSWKQFLDLPYGERNEEIEALHEPFPGAVTLIDIHEAKEEWGIGSPGWSSIIMGDFPPMSDRTLISMDGMMLARRGGAGLDKLPMLPPHLPALTGRWAGIDIAGPGRSADRTAICFVDGRRVQRIEGHRGLQIHETAALAIKALEDGYKLVYDETGLGVGLTSELSKTHYVKGRDYFPNNASASADDPKRYTRMRDQLWFTTADYLRMGYLDMSENELGGINEKDFNMLAAELTATDVHKESGKPSGQRRAESKEDVRAKLRRSPDLADALNLALWRPRATGGLSVDIGHASDESNILTMQF